MQHPIPLGFNIQGEQKISRNKTWIRAKQISTKSTIGIKL
jgi:hypothetical protein